MGKYDSKIDATDCMNEFKKMSPEEQNSIMNPGHVDEALWEKAKEAAAKEGHEEKWPLIEYIYKKMGGK